MRRQVHSVISKNHFIAWLCVVVGGCQTVPAPVTDPAATPVRFLLTFDDGPSGSPDNNTTLRILRQLDSNPVQKDVKALFFVQTRNAEGGGSEFGRKLLQMSHDQGHALGLHSGTDRGHIRHTLMSSEELAQSLSQGTDDLRAISRQDEPLIIRPTYWGYDNRTVEIYNANRYRMLLTDINSRDGIWLHSLVGMRNRIHKALLLSQQAIARGELPVYRDAIPLVVTFHDLNTITSHSLSSYMAMLTEEAATIGLRVAHKPFYDSREDILAVATLRAETPESLARRAQKKQQARTTAKPATTASVQPATALD